VLRLLVPLLVGIFTHVALQVYLERVSNGAFHGSFWAFVPHYFDGWYGFGGNFAWMGLHLWYLELLFIYSIVLLPLLRWLQHGAGQVLLRRLLDVLALPGAVYLLALPVCLLLWVINPRSALGVRDLGGWSLPIYSVFLLQGFTLVSHERLQQQIVHLRVVSLGVASCSSQSLRRWSSPMNFRSVPSRPLYFVGCTASIRGVGWWRFSVSPCTISRTRRCG
jgi:hypothetical protein